MMVKIFAIFEITVKKIKEPAFFLLFIIAAVIGYSVSGIEAISFNQNDGMLLGLISLEQGHTVLGGFVVILFMIAIVAVFSGDIDTRMIMLFLSKPIDRIEYLIGKYLGITAICIMFFMTSTIVFVISNLICTGQMIGMAVLFRQILLLLVIFPFVAMSMMISTFLSDIGAMIVTSAYLVLSLMASAFSIFVDMLPKSLAIVSFIHYAVYFFPNFFYFFNSFEFSGVVMLAMVLYSFSTTILFLSVAAARLNSRDIS
jgi:ABC-type transport system involved in multi-copper enzyme maturation permease subunit